MNPDFQQSHFALFGLPERFALDSAQLDQAWRAVAAEVHPDRYAHAGDAEKRVALMMATRVNEAYRTLKSPLARARYLLTLAGTDTQEETNTSMPGAFLMQQMTWRETIEDARRARDSATLDRLAAELRDETRQLEQQLVHTLDIERDDDQAALLVRKWRFLEKLGQEVDDALEQALS
ncbi:MULTISPECIES: Fe-S protein assembly co-chaperone HscB [unclassified Paludibacterium]|uniref:Fe-S protein assembly co-chaperone HscB n=1 Tax=unclassified Paludibacterium TaxID=2618429 RepID=UPI001C045FD1|nr:Fe-S protein assembly co-chaperone HscB [Paludibacterium sp. B53371]BEV72075.1 Fe-S protein assembly co-chaperone HscB [Paludibacterium sp. THUN1379]